MKKVLKIGLIFITVFVLLCQFGCVNAAIMDLNPEEYNPGEIGINEDVLICDKPAGILSQPDNKLTNDSVLNKERLTIEYEKNLLEKNLILQIQIR